MRIVHDPGATVIRICGEGYTDPILELDAGAATALADLLRQVAQVADDIQTAAPKGVPA